MAPIILLTVLYLPTILYVVVVSMKFYGIKNWFSSILDNPVYFIFPVLTSMSFYGKQSHQNEMNNISLKNVSDDQIERDHNTDIKEDSNDAMPLESADSVRMENESIETKDEASKDDDEDSISVFTHNSSNIFQDNSKSCAEEAIEPKEVQMHIQDTENVKTSNLKKRHVFSPEQSIVLYILFMIGYLFCIGGDLALQLYRSPYIPLYNTIAFNCLMFFLLNGLLWTDFIIHSFRSNENNLISGTGEISHLNYSKLILGSRGFFIDLLSYSTNIVFWILLIPFYIFKKIHQRYFHFLTVYQLILLDLLFQEILTKWTASTYSEVSRNL